MKSTVVGESLSTTRTRVLFQRRIYFLLNDTSEWEIYTKVTGQFRLPILVAPCWMEAPWLPTVLNMLAGIPH